MRARRASGPFVNRQQGPAGRNRSDSETSEIFCNYDDPVSALLSSGCAGTLEHPLNGEYQGADPAKDADLDNDPRGDFINYAIYYEPTALTLSLRLAQPSDIHTDPNWTDRELGSSVGWLVETTNDDIYDFSIEVAINRSGELVALVADLGGEVYTCIGSASMGNTIEMTIDPLTCLGGVGPLRFTAGVTYDTKTTSTFDSLPDNKDSLIGFTPWISPRQAVQ